MVESCIRAFSPETGSTYWYVQGSSPPSSLMMWLLGMKDSSSSRVLVKCTLEATTGSSQPFMMVQMPGWWVRN